jgi:hypothetical protein
MAERYDIIHKKHMVLKEDPISLEDLHPVAQGRKTISYLRLNRNVPVIMVYYDTQSAYTTFITNKFPKEPETNLPLNPGFKERIELYHSASSIPVEHAELMELCMLAPSSPEEKFRIDTCKRQLFHRYLRGETNDQEKLVLRLALFIDDANVVQTYMRPEANALLESSQVGQWLLRKSSHHDTDLITNRVVSMRCTRYCTNPQELDEAKHTYTDTKHYLITHIKGYGYQTSPRFPTRALLGMLSRPELNENPQDSMIATFGDQIPIPIGITVYPCFIDALEIIFRTNAEIVRGQLIGMDV